MIKMILKRLLFGVVASLIVMIGAQAADLPAKAKPIQYVKICSLYGNGFFYIPGTDTCIKFGGYMRSEWNYNATGNFNAEIAGVNGLGTRNQNSLVGRARFLTSFDVRSETEYGTLRAYTRAAYQWTTGDPIEGGSGASLYMDHAFLQLGGFTFGKTQSFFDVPDITAYSTGQLLNENTFATGVPVLAYTALLGNGVSTTLSIEDHWEWQAPIVNLGVGGAVGVAALPLGATQVSSAAGVKVPDVVANLRVDQSWGSAQISGALHNNSAAYYSTVVGDTTHPSDALGSAAAAGISINLPMLGQRDTMTFTGQYCNGASDYCHEPQSTNNGVGFGLVNGSTVGVGWFNDAYYNSTTKGGLELSKNWNVEAGINHYWVPTWQTSLWGVYNRYQANSNAVDTLVCAALALGPGCADFKSWEVGSRTIWNPVVNLDVIVEVEYTRIQTAMAGAAFAGAVGTPAVLTAGDTGVWSGILRFQRNFWP